ncbi:MAG: NAD(+) diphosphatase [Legionellales bacterium]|nr:NAD(+) diphosphatase [Legionellales bacterium]
MHLESSTIADGLQTYATFNALIFMDEGILVGDSTDQPLLPLKASAEAAQLDIHCLHVDGATVIVKGQSKLTITQLRHLGFAVYPVRAFLTQLDETLQHLILRAYHWLNWDAQTRYCGQCGHPLDSQCDVIVKQCRRCNQQVFPRFSPAIMVLIQRQNEILLARSPHFKPGVYSAIAGFIEMGETAEQAVHREVQEELGLQITQLTYFHSQSWPFPDSFMIAFTANYLAGELVMDPGEIEDAQWFGLTDLPKLPMSSSIARRLIDSVRLSKKDR